jgi:hypothetical protein
LDDCIREFGFFPCKVEPDIWIQRKNNLYEYIAVYIDDLAIAMENPKEFTNILYKIECSSLRELVQFTFTYEWTLPGIALTHCVFQQPNTLTNW